MCDVSRFIKERTNYQAMSSMIPGSLRLLVKVNNSKELFLCLFVFCNFRAFTHQYNFMSVLLLNYRWRIKQATYFHLMSSLQYRTRAIIVIASNLFCLMSNQNLKCSRGGAVAKYCNIKLTPLLCVLHRGNNRRQTWHFSKFSYFFPPIFVSPIFSQLYSPNMPPSLLILSVYLSYDHRYQAIS